VTLRSGVLPMHSLSKLLDFQSKNDGAAIMQTV